MADEGLLDKATRVVAEVRDGIYIQEGLVVVASGGKNLVVQVFVVNDVSLSPYDLIDPRDTEAYEAGELGVAVLNPIGEGKALLRCFGF